MGPRAITCVIACLASVKRGGGRGGGREFGQKTEDQGGGRGGKNACYKDPYWFISAVAGGRKILIG